MIQDLMEIGSIGTTSGSYRPPYAVSLTYTPSISIDMSSATTSALLSLDSQTANWVLKSLRKLESLGNLQRGWNSYDGLPLSPNAKKITFDALEWLKHQDLPVPAVVLGSGGTVHLEWRSNGKELEVGFGGNGISEYLKVDPHGYCEEGEGADEEIRDKLIKLTEWLRND